MTNYAITTLYVRADPATTAHIRSAVIPDPKPGPFQGEPMFDLAAFLPCTPDRRRWQWGTKWNTGAAEFLFEDDIPDATREVAMRFVTPGQGPIPVLEALRELPGVHQVEYIVDVPDESPVGDHSRGAFTVFTVEQEWDESHDMLTDAPEFTYVGLRSDRYAVGF